MFKVILGYIVNSRLGWLCEPLPQKQTNSSGDGDITHRAHWWGAWLCMWFTVLGEMIAFGCLAFVGEKKKTKRASVLCMSFGICTHTVFLNVFKVCLDFCCLLQSCMMHSFLPPKNYFVFSKTLHVLLELHRRCWFAIYWITEHMGSFTVLSLGRAVCELRTGFGFGLFCVFLLSNVNMLLFKSLNHFSIIWTFTLYFYKHTQP